MKKITFLIVTLLAFTVQSYAQFPSPYCGPITWEYDEEPITSVVFAGINNTSPAALASGEGHQDFTTVFGSVDTGASYPIAVKGNTGGAWTNYIRVYFDWNHDNDFLDAGEGYDLGTIVSSTGLDAVQATGSITVPPGALAGTTRMRVIKAYAGYADSCNTGALGFGQAEDYSVTVVIPSCVAPASLSATVTSSTSANLAWTSAGTEGAIVVQTAGTGTPSVAPGTGVVVSGSNSYTASPLLPMTAYEFYVRNECTPGAFSSWSGPFAFNTTQLPGCTSNPTPADGATNVPVGDVTFSWTAPTTGDPVVSYDMYYGLTPGNATLFVGNFPTTTALITLNGFNTAFYWKIVPKNIAGSATGCAEWMFTTQPAPGYCLNAPSGQYPGGAAGYTPTTCDGIAVNEITTAGWASEYSLINVTSGQTYTFSSSVATDFLTISNFEGTTSFIAGVTPVTWVSTVTGQIRFYNHTDDQCNTENTARTRGVVCGVPATDAPDFANLQWPETLTFLQGGSGTVYGQVYEAGLTDVAPNIAGQAPGIQAWVGISPIGANTDPATWTNWTVATHNAANVGNNDEYMATIGATLVPGTYYYATRFRLNNGGFVYGGFDGGFWNGTTEPSGVLTVTAPPAPANDNCSGAIALTVNPDFACAAFASGSTFGATLSMAATPCFGNPDDDVWFSFVATATSHQVALTNVVAVFGTSTDMYFQVLSGACGAGTSVLCSDANTGLATGLTIGNTYYVRVYSYGNTSNQTFNICVGTPPAPPANDECASAVMLTAGGTYAAYPTNGTNASATTSSQAAPTTCNGFVGGDVWYSVVVPANGNITIETGLATTGGSPLDTVFTVYTGTCGALTQINCDDDGAATEAYSLKAMTGLTPGSTIYIRVYEYSNDVQGTFAISAYDSSLSTNSFDRANFSYYPNPVQNVLNLSYTKNITSVSIFNLLGQQVLDVQMNASEGQVDMSRLASGAYLVKVSADNEVQTIKVIKE